MPDTIYAESTAPGRAGVAVIRLSGPGAFDATARLVRSLPAPRTAGKRWLRDPQTGQQIDEALILTFPGPASFTGEDVVELHTHGSRAVIRGLLDRLSLMPGLRLAEPGEFTRRALLNGKIDLVQTEGLSDLLTAETEAQRRQALETMSGTVSKRAGHWRDEIVDILARIEVTIDFADEELPDELLTPLIDRLQSVTQDMGSIVAGSGMAERVRDGFKVAVVGRPNVGKSTLLNALAGRDAAITSDIAGTTRDVIEVRMDLAGIPVTLMDMAGIRESSDTIEALGVDRARGAADQADLRLFLLDAMDDLDDLGVTLQPGDIAVLSKSDLRPARTDPSVSGLSGDGIEDLIARLRQSLEDRVQNAGPVSHKRQIDAIGKACMALSAGAEHIRSEGAMVEQASIELRTALRELEFLIGQVGVEDVLDVIFQSFCLGK